MPPGVSSSHVLLLVRKLDRGGAERQLCVLASGLAARGHGVTVAVFYAGGSLQPELEERGIDVASLDKGDRYDILGPCVRLATTARRRRSSVVYSFLTDANIISAVARPLMPPVRLAWGIRSSEMKLARFGRAAQMSFAASRLLSSCPDVLIANSVAGSRWYVERGYPAARMHVVPNGIDSVAFQPDAVGAAALRRTLGLAADAFVVGMIGRFDPMKDHTTFLAAAGRLSGEMPGARFIVAGGGDERLRRAFEEKLTPGLRAVVHLIGERADMPQVYSACDVCTLASHGEGFPNVIGEAMACGTPCVATEVGDVAMLIGSTGRVTAEGDAEGLAAAWREVHDADPASLGRAARARVVSLFSVDRMISGTEALLLA